MRLKQYILTTIVLIIVGLVVGVPKLPLWKIVVGQAVLWIVGYIIIDHKYIADKISNITADIDTVFKLLWMLIITFAASFITATLVAFGVEIDYIILFIFVIAALLTIRLIHGRKNEKNC